MGDRVIKTAKGSPVPQGWSIVRSTRTTQYIKKDQAAPVPQDEFDQLLAAFSSFGIAAQVVPAADVAMDTSGGKFTRHRSSSPKWKAGRSSSSSKRNYTRRRRA